MPGSGVPCLADAAPLSLVDLRGHPAADAFGGDQLAAGDLLLSIDIQTCESHDFYMAMLGGKSRKLDENDDFSYFFHGIYREL